MSPYAKPHYVSHVVDDHTSILRFIETRYGLPSLTARDAAADPMLGMFDFSTPALLNAPAFPAPTVTPCTAPTISLHPNSQTVNAGHTVTFTAAASTETAPKVQWQLSVDHGSTWFDVAGLTSPRFSATAIPFVNGWQVRAVFTNPIGTATNWAGPDRWEMSGAPRASHTTRLVPQITAIAAKIMNRRASISGEKGHQKGRDEQIDQRHGEHEGPCKAHQLIVAEARQSRAYPDKHEQDDEHLRAEPE